ncbi:hypothetical protein WH91_20985 [Devosia psychrophila]|uniref:Uncharacterized protein n=1 Tax=Devosia psychrophila TaxID=728005 RepID=A0ABR5DT17_9HYPH|nr:hypothetical protein WH91_20985 [Devosia psychrophila]
MTGMVLFTFASLTSAEFTAKLLDRLTFAKSYDLGEEGRYRRYLLVLPMILQNPIGLGVLQFEKIFPSSRPANVLHHLLGRLFGVRGFGGHLGSFVIRRDQNTP